MIRRQNNQRQRIRTPATAPVTAPATAPATAPVTAPVTAPISNTTGSIVKDIALQPVVPVQMTDKNSQPEQQSSEPAQSEQQSSEQQSQMVEEISKNNSDVQKSKNMFDRLVALEEENKNLRTKLTLIEKHLDNPIEYVAFSDKDMLQYLNTIDSKLTKLLTSK